MNYKMHQLVYLYKSVSRNTKAKEARVLSKSMTDIEKRS